MVRIVGIVGHDGLEIGETQQLPLDPGLIDPGRKDIRLVAPVSRHCRRWSRQG